MNIIGDIAGQYDALMELLRIMPDEEPISVGDIIDRGPKSKEVLDFFMKNGRAVLGNHEHMMIDAYEGCHYYEEFLWEHNGGWATKESFDAGRDVRNINLDYIEYLRSLPLFIEEKDIFISHAAKNPALSIKQCCYTGIYGFKQGRFMQNEFHKIDSNLLWNRGTPRRMKNKFQVHGHNAHKDTYWYKDKEGDYAVDVDTSFGKKLTGVNWPSKKIYQVEF